MVQDDRGIMYFGNGNGVLEFDGNHWRIIHTSNKSLVRALAKDSTGRIFVGGQDELGYLAPDSIGSMRYVSLLGHIDSAQRGFGDVAKVIAMPSGVYFQTFGAIFQWSHESMQVIIEKKKRGIK